MIGSLSGLGFRLKHPSCLYMYVVRHVYSAGATPECGVAWWRGSQGAARVRPAHAGTETRVKTLTTASPAPATRGSRARTWRPRGAATRAARVPATRRGTASPACSRQQSSVPPTCPARPPARVSGCPGERSRAPVREVPTVLTRTGHTSKGSNLAQESAGKLVNTFANNIYFLINF